MTTRAYYVIALLLIGASLVTTVIVYPRLPATVATHWGMSGEPNGYSPKWAFFLLGPGVMTAFLLLMRFLPWLSPKHFEVDSFRSTFLRIMLIFVCMFAYFYAVILWVNLGHSLNVSRAIVGGVCLLFALLGNVMGKIRRNFYVGVRTPWALADERVWNATHRFAAKTFVVGGLAGLALTAAGLDGWPAFSVLIAGAMIPAIYSLVLYKRLEQRGEL